MWIRLITLICVSLTFMANANTSLAQTGACCVDFECVGTVEDDSCWWMGGQWYEGENCEEDFECLSEYPCGSYVAGDFNGSGEFNIADVMEAYSDHILPRYPYLLCECPHGSNNLWHVRFDLNNSCSMNMADIITAYSKLKTGSPEPVPCELCPPY